MKKTLLSILLSLAMCLSLLPTSALALPSTGSESVSYIAENGMTVTQYGCTPIASTTQTLSSGWYVVYDDVTTNGSLTVSGEVNLVLCDGMTLTTETVNIEGSGSSLTIYGQSGQTGKLSATGTEPAGILVENGSSLIVNGGVVEATGGPVGNSSGIQLGAHESDSSSLIVNGGRVVATGQAAGEPYSSYGIHIPGTGSLTVNGGEVEAIGGTVSDSGVSYGVYLSASSSMTFNSGSLIAASMDDDRGAALARILGNTMSLPANYSYRTSASGSYTQSVGTSYPPNSGLYLELTTAASAGSDDDGIAYLDWAGLGKPMTKKSCADATKLTSDMTVWQAGWLYVEGNVTIDETVTLNDDVSLILCDEAHLNITGGIDGSNGCLTIYGQSDGADRGKLTVTGSVEDSNNYTAAIRIMELTVNGGEISFTCDENTSDTQTNSRGIEIRGSNGVTVNGGKLTAIGGAAPGGGMSYGISAEYAYNNGVTVNGGTLIATGSMVGQAGAADGTPSLPSGKSYGIFATSVTVAGGTLTATGGKVETTSDAMSCGILASSGLTVSGGKVTATGSDVRGNQSYSVLYYVGSYGLYVRGGSGSGEYSLRAASGRSSSADLAVSGGTVDAIGGAAENTKSFNPYAYSCGIYVDDDSVIALSGGTVNTQTGSAVAEYPRVWDISTGWRSSMTVSDCTVQKKGTNGGAVIVNSEGSDLIFRSGTLCLAEGSIAKKICAPSLAALNALPEDGCGYHEKTTVYDPETNTVSPVYDLLSDEDVTYDSSSGLYCLIFSDGRNPEGGICVRTVTTAKNVPYLNRYGASRTCASAQKLLSSDTDVTLESGWYVVQGDVTIKGMISVEGDVHLILADGCQLTVNGKKSGVSYTTSTGIQIESDASLTVYGQSRGSSVGKLDVSAPKADNSTCAIYLASGGTSGSLTINGGDITATGGQVGGSSYGVYLNKGKTLTVNGGKLTAIGGTSNLISNGICADPSAAILVNGGEVEATGGQASRSSAGIYLEATDILTVNGGKVTANGGKVTDSDTEYGSFGINGKQAKLIYGTLIAGSSTDCPIGVSSRTFGTLPVLPASYQWRTAETGDYTASTATAYTVGSEHYVELTAGVPTDAVSYLDENGSTAYCTLYTPMNTSTTALTEGWYAVRGNVILNGPLTFTGEVHLILCDNATLTAPMGISGAGDLTIYAQSKQDTTSTRVGRLVATDPTAIVDGEGDGNGILLYVGDLTVNGGVIEASAPNAMHGSGIYLVNGSMTVNEGTVNAIGGRTTVAEGATTGVFYYGIYIEDGKLTVNGGTVNGTGGTVRSMVDGNDDTEERNSFGVYVRTGIITVTGGELNAAAGDMDITHSESTTSPRYVFGISGGLRIYNGTKLRISGGHVTATGGDVTVTGTAGHFALSYGANIAGSMELSDGSLTAIGGTATVSGSDVTTSYSAYSESYGLSIGGYEDANETYVEASPVISGGRFKAAGGNATVTVTNQTTNSTPYSESIALYTSDFTVSGGTVELSHGTAAVTATGSNRSSRITALDLYAFGDLTVSGGTMKLKESRIYDQVTVSNGVKLADLLADEYAYWREKRSGAGSDVPASDFIKLADLTDTLPQIDFVDYYIRPCTYTLGNGRCPYCGQVFGTLMPEVSYLDDKGAGQICDVYDLVESTTTALAEGWYVVQGNVTLSAPLLLTGDANLILCNGATLTAPKGIVDEDQSYTLTIYGQAEETGKKTGKLTVGGYTLNENSTAILVSCLFVNGGEIEATADSHTTAVPVAASFGVNARGLLMNGGKLTATGGAVSGEDCISGGVYIMSNRLSLLLNGGQLIANGGTASGKNSASIGAGAYLLIGNGGKLTATGGKADGEGSESNGVYAALALIYGGEVKGTADTAVGSSYGIYAQAALSVNDKTIDPNVLISEIAAETDFTINTAATPAVVEGTGGTVTGEDGISAGIYSGCVSADGVNFMLMMMLQSGISLDTDDDAADGSVTTPATGAEITANGGTAEMGISYGIVSDYSLYVGLTIEDIFGDMGGGADPYALDETQDGTQSPVSERTAEITATGKDVGVATTDIISLYMGLPSVWLNGGKLTAIGGESGVLVIPFSTDSLSALADFGLDVLDGEGGDASTAVPLVYVQKGTLIADATGTTPGLALDVGRPVSADVPVKCPTAYWWRTDKAGSYTTCPTTPYVYDGQESYVEITDTEPTAVYTVKFDANGGSGKMKDVQVPIDPEEDTTYTLPACGFTAPTGKAFYGWQVGSITLPVGTEITLTENITVTAVWRTAITAVDFTLGGYAIGSGITASTLSMTATPAGSLFPTTTYDGDGFMICTGYDTTGTAVGAIEDASATFAAGGTYYLAVVLFPMPGYSVESLTKENVTLGGTKAAEALFSPAGGIKLAYFKLDPLTAPATKHTVTVSDGGTGASGAGSYAKDTAVTISAGTREGFVFDKWVSSDGVTFADATSATTTFTMPDKDVTVTAKWLKVITAIDFTMTGYTLGANVSDLRVTTSTTGITLDGGYGSSYFISSNSGLPTATTDTVFAAGKNYKLNVAFDVADGYTLALTLADVKLNGASADTVNTNWTVFNLAPLTDTPTPTFVTECISDYVSGYYLVLVYTNDSGSISFDNKAMYDVTSAGYKYNGTAYSHVYATVVKGGDGITANTLTAKVKADASVTATVLTCNTLDVNSSGTVDLRDAVAAVAVYNVNETYMTEHLPIVLKADVDHSKKVDASDFNKIKVEYLKND